MLPPPHDPLAFKDESSSTEIKKENASLVKILDETSTKTKQKYSSKQTQLRTI